MLLDDELRAALQAREADGLRRALRPIPEGAIDLASNDYLGMSRHPRVIEAACRAAREYGAGARASRLVSGHFSLVEELESALARWKKCEAALVFSSGYAANLAVISSLARAGDVVFCDKRNHASLIDACRLAAANGAAVRYYGSPEKLRALLQNQEAAPRRLIVSDAVYSMDGDLADVPALLSMAEEFDAVLILDDAHGSGTLGATGRGTLAHFGLSNARIIQIGTLSKALGAQGGFVVGSRVLVEWLVNQARPFIYTTGLNPAACGAALESLRVLQDEPQHLLRLRAVHRRLVDGLQRVGFDAKSQASPIIPVVVGDAARAVALSDKLLEAGVWCPAIRPPTVPPNTSRLRVTANTALSEAQIERALKTFAAHA